MKTLENGETEYESTDMATFHGITATRREWSAVGLRFYCNTNGLSSDTPYELQQHLHEGLMLAQDSLPPGADGSAIIRRFATIRKQQKEHIELCAALKAISVNVPSNINVWQHLKGESSLRSAAETLQAAAKALTDKISQ